MSGSLNCSENILNNPYKIKNKTEIKPFLIFELKLINIRIINNTTPSKQAS